MTASRSVLPWAILGSALAWLPITARATVVTQDGTFATTDQDLFQPGTTPFNFSFDCLQNAATIAGCYGSGGHGGPLGISWPNLSASKSGPSIIPTLPGSWTISGNLAAGYAGFDPVINLSAGSVSVNYPVKLTYDLPSAARAHQLIDIDTSFARTNTPLLNIAGENYKASLDLVASIDGDVKDTYFPLIGGPRVLFDQTVNPGVIKQTLLSVGPGNLSKSLSIPGFSSGVSLNVPNLLNLMTDRYGPGGNLFVRGAAFPPIVSADLDAADAIVAIAGLFGIPIPPLSGSAGPFDYSIISGKLQVGPSLFQSSDFSVNNLPITLTANTGQVERGHVGQDFDFRMPASGPLIVSTTVGINNTYATKEGLSLAAGFSWNVLSASIGFGDVKFIKLGPLFSGNTTPVTTDCLYCWTDTKFPLQGFNTLANQLMVPQLTSPVPEPPALAALIVGAFFITMRRRHYRRSAATIAPRTSGD